MSVIVSQSNTGQCTVTLPAHIVELLDLKKGDRVRWRLASVPCDLIFEKVPQ